MFDASKAILIGVLLLITVQSDARGIVYRHDVGEANSAQFAQQYPFTAMGIVNAGFSGGRRAEVGSGTLIRSNYILTAAHLFDDADFSRPGLFGFEIDGRLLPVDGLFIHPDYVNRGGGELPGGRPRDEIDLAIVRLTEPALGVIPAQTSVVNPLGDNFRGSDSVFIAGFGHSGNGLQGATEPAFELLLAGTNTVAVTQPGVPPASFIDTKFEWTFDSPTSSSTTALEVNIAGGDSGGGVFKRVTASSPTIRTGPTGAINYLVGVNSESSATALTYGTTGAGYALDESFFSAVIRTTNEIYWIGGTSGAINDEGTNWLALDALIGGFETPRILTAANSNTHSLHLTSTYRSFQPFDFLNGNWDIDLRGHQLTVENGVDVTGQAFPGTHVVFRNGTVVSELDFSTMRRNPVRNGQFLEVALENATLRSPFQLNMFGGRLIVDQDSELLVGEANIIGELSVRAGGIMTAGIINVGFTTTASGTSVFEPGSLFVDGRIETTRIEVGDGSVLNIGENGMVNADVFVNGGEFVGAGTVGGDLIVNGSRMIVASPMTVNGLLFLDEASTLIFPEISGDEMDTLLSAQDAIVIDGRVSLSILGTGLFGDSRRFSLQLFDAPNVDSIDFDRLDIIGLPENVNVSFESGTLTLTLMPEPQPALLLAASMMAICIMRVRPSQNLPKIRSIASDV